MEEPLTEEVLAELLESDDLNAFLKKPEVGSRTLAEYLNELLDRKGLKRSTVVQTAGIDNTYGYQLFKGSRTRAGRDYLLRLAFAMGLTRTEANRLLQAGGVSQLYCKNRRDAIIVYALENGYSLQKAQETLYGFKADVIE